MHTPLGQRLGFAISTALGLSTLISIPVLAQDVMEVATSGITIYENGLSTQVCKSVRQIGGNEGLPFPFSGAGYG